MGRGSFLSLVFLVFFALSCSRPADLPESAEKNNRYIVRFKQSMAINQLQVVANETQRLRASAGGEATIEKIHQNVYVIDYLISLRLTSSLLKFGRSLLSVRRLASAFANSCLSIKSKAVVYNWRSGVLMNLSQTT